MPVTYSQISSQTLSSSTNIITLNSFSGYTDLRIIVNYFATGDGVETLQLNGSGGTDYEQMILNSFTGASSGGVSNYKSYVYASRGDFYTYGGWNQSGTTTPAVIDLYIPFYARTDTFKYVFGSYGSGNANAGAGDNFYEHDLWQGQWKSTSAITSITLNRTTNTFAAGTVVSLYGITEA